MFIPAAIRLSNPKVSDAGRFGSEAAARGEGEGMDMAVGGEFAIVADPDCSAVIVDSAKSRPHDRGIPCHA